MKTLYLSDLDGTLLNSEAEISNYTKVTLNTMIASGMYFSVATARTGATALKILDGLTVTVPVILMNGVCIYDPVSGHYVKVESIPAASRPEMFRLFKKYGLSGFLFTVEGENLNTYYENTDTPNAKAFIEERIKKYNKVFTKVDDFSKYIAKNIVYYSISDKKEKLEQACGELSADPNLNVEFYRDVYNEDFWYMEICSGAASKYNAVRFLRERYGFDKVVSFGDNLNDLPLFSASDECYAVKNAKPEIKARATEVIGSNNDDGVARWLKTNAEF